MTKAPTTTRDLDPVNTLVAKAIEAQDGNEACAFATAALTVAKAVALNDLATLFKAAVAAQLDNA